MQRNSILAGAVAAAALLAAPLYAEDVEFQSWTFGVETGRAAIQSLADSTSVTA